MHISGLRFIRGIRKKVYEKLNKFGRIFDITIIRDKGAQDMAYGFVTFIHRKDAEEAIRVLNGAMNDYNDMLKLSWSRSYKGKTMLNQGGGEQLKFLAELKEEEKRSLFFSGLDTRSNYIQGVLIDALNAANILHTGGNYKITDIKVVSVGSSGKITATFESAETADAIYNMRPNDRRVGLIVSRTFPVCPF